MIIECPKYYTKCNNGLQTMTHAKITTRGIVLPTLLKKVYLSTYNIYYMYELKSVSTIVLQHKI